jgi:hypothetical protein
MLFTLMRIRIQIRIQLFPLMQIRNQIQKIMRIHTDPQPRTTQYKTHHVNGGVLVGAGLGGGPGLGLQVEGGDPVEAVHGEGGAAPQHV